MHKQVIAFIGLLIFSSQSFVQAQSADQWECALDLHQGDKGTLTLNRSGDDLDGIIRFSRNGNEFESEVSGSWNAGKIDLTRLLDADSTELMTGIAVALGTKKMNIGGRYSAGFQGVWSANCDLVSESSGSESVDSETFTSTKVSPESPTSKQKVTFSVSASHPEGIKQVSIFLGNEEIHTCTSEECEFSYGPFSKGIYSWRVEALSNSGAKSVEMDRIAVKSSNSKSQKSKQLTVSSQKKVVNDCSISGRATGAYGPLAEIYSVKLYGPDTTNLLKASSGFVNGVYQFKNLPAGQYQLTVDTKGDQEVSVFPDNQVLNCKSKSTLTQDISFN